MPHPDFPAQALALVRSRSPLIHCITNYVTANDCANLLLACGASPIMADEVEEVREITALSQALVLNLGTLNRRTIPAMLLAGKTANELGRPVVLDPVGAGASQLRTDTARTLLEQIRFSVIRGNSSEIKALAAGAGSTRGVDAALADAVTEETLDRAVAFVRDFSRRTGAVITLTGAIDLVSDAATTYCIQNGHPMMGSVTGTGCQLTALTAAFVAAQPKQPLTATAAAVMTMGLAGELAHRRLSPWEGNAAYRRAIIDAIYRMDSETLKAGARYEVQ